MGVFDKASHWRRKKGDLIPPGWFEQWVDATWATDPDSAKHNPPLLRAPNGQGYRI
jgi:hypothetical protein